MHRLLKGGHSWVAGEARQPWRQCCHRLRTQVRRTQSSLCPSDIWSDRRGLISDMRGLMTRQYSPCWSKLNSDKRLLFAVENKKKHHKIHIKSSSFPGGPIQPTSLWTRSPWPSSSATSSSFPGPYSKVGGLEDFLTWQGRGWGPGSDGIPVPDPSRPENWKWLGTG